MNDFQSMLEAWNEPAQRHAILVHLPIALAIFNIPLTLLVALRPKNAAVRWLAVASALALIVASFLALNSGQHADNAIDLIMTPDVSALIHAHEDMAEKVWLFGVGSVLLLALSALKIRVVAPSSAWLAFALSLVACGWISVTAHRGGSLVYDYGVGTPQPVACYDIEGVQADGRDHSLTRSNSQPALDPEAQKAAFFRAEVLPILSNICMRCHNPDKAERSGHLDQTSLAAIMKGGWSGPAIVIGKPEESEMIRRVRRLDPNDDPMPPKNPLSEQQIQALEKWIRDGAVWDSQAVETTDEHG